MNNYTPIEAATALSLYGYNVSPRARAENLYYFFRHRNLPCGEPEDLLAHCQNYKNFATEMPHATAVLYIQHALEKYGEEARNRCRINAGGMSDDFVAALEGGE